MMRALDALLSILEHAAKFVQRFHRPHAGNFRFAKIFWSRETENPWRRRLLHRAPHPGRDGLLITFWSSRARRERIAT